MILICEPPPGQTHRRARHRFAGRLPMSYRPTGPRWRRQAPALHSAPRRPPEVVCPIGFQPNSGSRLKRGLPIGGRWHSLSDAGEGQSTARESEVTTGADVAQLVEQLTRNEQVVRSSRIVGSIYVCGMIMSRSSSSHLESLKSALRPEAKTPRAVRNKDPEPCRRRQPVRSLGMHVGSRRYDPEETAKRPIARWPLPRLRGCHRVGAAAVLPALRTLEDDARHQGPQIARGVSEEPELRATCGTPGPRVWQHLVPCADQDGLQGEFE